jgi:hypothetical protein
MSKPPENLNEEARLRHELVALLNGRQAHMSLADAVANFPVEHINSFPPNVPYTFWHLLEHLRIAQSDILEFIINPDYQSPPWPEGYWPAPEARASVEDWQQSFAAFTADQEQLVKLARDPDIDLSAELPHAPGYTILREIIVAADHNAYHTGELAIFRQIMDLW